MQRWRPRFFIAFAIANTEQKKRTQKREEKEQEKSESAGCERNKFKCALFPPFAAPHWKPGSRVQIHSAGGKARVLSKVYACPCCMFVVHVRAACP